MSDLRWLCEVVHTWGKTLVGRCPSGVSRSVGTMSDAHEVQRCDFCKRGHVTGCNEGISFRQYTDKSYVFCRVEIPIGVCDCCGAKHWNQDAEAIINEVVRREYDKLRQHYFGARTLKPRFRQPLADIRFAPKAAK